MSSMSLALQAGSLPLSHWGNIHRLPEVRTWTYPFERHDSSHKTHLRVGQEILLDSNGDSVCGHLLTGLVHAVVSALCQDLVREDAPEKLMTE